jgi:hypothetical protein
MSKADPAPISGPGSLVDGMAATLVSFLLSGCATALGLRALGGGPHPTGRFFLTATVILVVGQLVFLAVFSRDAAQLRSARVWNHAIPPPSLLRFAPSAAAIAAIVGVLGAAAVWGMVDSERSGGLVRLMRYGLWVVLVWSIVLSWLLRSWQGQLPATRTPLTAARLAMTAGLLVVSGLGTYIALDESPNPLVNLSRADSKHATILCLAIVGLMLCLDALTRLHFLRARLYRRPADQGPDTPSVR